MSEGTIIIKKGGKEIDSRSVIPEIPSLVDDGSGIGQIEREPIIAVTETVQDDYVKELAFNEEILEVRIEPGREEFAPKSIPVAVQGVRVDLPVGIPLLVKRKYVEVLARARPISVRTAHEGTESKNPINRTFFDVIAQNPFSIIRDDNPRGRQWIQDILATR